MPINQNLPTLDRSLKVVIVRLAAQSSYYSQLYFYQSLSDIEKQQHEISQLVVLELQTNDLPEIHLFESS